MRTYEVFGEICEIYDIFLMKYELWMIYELIIEKHEGNFTQYWNIKMFNHLKVNIFIYKVPIWRMAYQKICLSIIKPFQPERNKNIRYLIFRDLKC